MCYLYCQVLLLNMERNHCARLSRVSRTTALIPRSSSSTKDLPRGNGQRAVYTPYFSKCFRSIVTDTGRSGSRLKKNLDWRYYCNNAYMGITIVYVTTTRSRSVRAIIIYIRMAKLFPTADFTVVFMRHDDVDRRDTNQQINERLKCR